jgi:hypothetical protein
MPENENDEYHTGPVYPSYENASGTQAAASTYNRHYTVPEPSERPVYQFDNTGAYYLEEIVRYIMQDMEPTDRALRPYGDIYPAKGTKGNRPGVWNGWRPMPGNEPYDGENIPDPNPARKLPGWRF